MFGEIMGWIVFGAFMLFMIQLIKASIQQRAEDKKNYGKQYLHPDNKCCLHPDNNQEFEPHHLPKSEIKVPMPPVTSPKEEATKIIEKSKEKERIITDDEIRFHAYMLAAADGFKGDNKEYWYRAEKELRGN